MTDVSERIRQLELAGQGGMAEVFRGVLAGERGANKVVAVKRLRPELKEDPQTVDLFVNEARITVRLNHPNVVQGIEFGRDDAEYFLVCEWLDGVTLDDILASRGSIPWQATAAIGIQLSEALEYLHRFRAADGTPARIVHRDVSPGNVFVTREGCVKLTDFGVALCESESYTPATSVVGTPGFAAPEQIEGETGDRRSDVYGLGATLRALSPDMPEALFSVVEQATQADAEDRYQNATELKTALMHAVAQLEHDVSASVLRNFVDQLDTDTFGIPPQPTPKLDHAVESILGYACSARPQTQPPPRCARARTTASRTLTWAGLSLLVLGTTLAFSIWNNSNGQQTPVPLPARESAIRDVGRHYPHPFETPRTRDEPPPGSVDAPPSQPAVGTRDVDQRPAPPSPTPRKKPTQRKQPPQPLERKPSKPTEVGRVNINAVPWAEVKVNGRSIGNTPLGQVQLPAGRHRLELHNPAKNLTRDFWFEVVPNENQTLVADLARGTLSRNIVP